MGSSAEEISRLITSISSKNVAPMMKDSPNVSELSVPIMVLTNREITRPIHPMEPATETATDTKIVELTRNNSLYLLMLNPMFVASLSE